MYRYSLLIISFCLMAFTPIYSQGNNVKLNAEIMPHWKDCGDAVDKLDCTKQAFHQYVSENLKYPQRAKEKEIQGNVIVSFVVDTKGEIQQANVMYDIGYDCGKEAMRLIEGMPNWLPGSEKGTAVSVIYNLEVPFLIQDDKKTVNTALTEAPSESPKKKIADLYANKPPKDTKPIRPVVPVAEKPVVINGGDIEMEESEFPIDFTETPSGRIYIRAEQMPYFKGCENTIDGSLEKRTCSNHSLVQYLSSNIKYPEAAQTAKTEGMVYMNFTIDETGKVIAPKILRDIGNGCGEEALRIVAAMPKWEPGKVNGIPVRVKMNLPVRFYLNNGSNGQYRIHWANLKGSKISLQQLLEASNDKPVIRDAYGDETSLARMTISYERNGKVKEEDSTGKYTDDMKRLVRKAKSNSLVTISANLQSGGKSIEIFRTFEILK